MTCPYAIHLAGIDFDDTFDSNGFFWTWNSFDGWFGSDVKVSMLDIAGGEGQVVGQIRRSSKPLVLAGFGGVSNGDDWWRAATALETAIAGISNAASPGTVIVDEPDDSKSLEVFHTGRMQLARQGSLMSVGATGVVVCGFVFSIPLIAPNPVKATV